MKILITGFDPFGGEATNPAWETVRRLPDEVAGAQVIKVQIPTVFGKCAEVTRAAIIEHDPDVIVNVGQAGGRYSVNPERVAINIDDGRIEDNEGFQPIDVPIKADGPPAYFSTLPIKAMATAMQEAGIPAAVSNTAGTYVCNHIMYQVRYMVEHEFPGKRSGFVHVPYLPSQVLDKPNMPSLGLDELVVALTAGLEAIVEFTDKPDLVTVGGALH